MSGRYRRTTADVRAANEALAFIATPPPRPREVVRFAPTPPLAQEREITPRDNRDPPGPVRRSRRIAHLPPSALDGMAQVFAQPFAVPPPPDSPQSQGASPPPAITPPRAMSPPQAMTPPQAVRPQPVMTPPQAVSPELVNTPPVAISPTMTSPPDLTGEPELLVERPQLSARRTGATNDEPQNKRARIEPQDNRPLQGRGRKRTLSGDSQEAGPSSRPDVPQRPPRRATTPHLEQEFVEEPFVMPAGVPESYRAFCERLHRGRQEAKRTAYIERLRAAQEAADSGSDSESESERASGSENEVEFEEPDETPEHLVGPPLWFAPVGQSSPQPERPYPRWFLPPAMSTQRESDSSSTLPPSTGTSPHASSSPMSDSEPTLSPHSTTASSHLSSLLPESEPAEEPQNEPEDVPVNEPEGEAHDMPEHEPEVESGITLVPYSSTSSSTSSDTLSVTPPPQGIEGRPDLPPNLPEGIAGTIWLFGARRSTRPTRQPDWYRSIDFRRPRRPRPPPRRANSPPARRDDSPPARRDNSPPARRPNSPPARRNPPPVRRHSPPARVIPPEIPPANVAIERPPPPPSPPERRSLTPEEDESLPSPQELPPTPPEQPPSPRRETPPSPEIERPQWPELEPLIRPEQVELPPPPVSPVQGPYGTIIVGGRRRSTRDSRAPTRWAPANFKEVNRRRQNPRPY